MWKLVQKLRCFRNKLGDVHHKQTCTGKEVTNDCDDRLVLCSFDNDGSKSDANFHQRSSPRHPGCSFYEAVSWSTAAILGLQVLFHEKKRKQCWVNILNEHHKYPRCPFGWKHRDYDASNLRSVFAFNVLSDSAPNRSQFFGEFENDEEPGASSVKEEVSKDFPRYEEVEHHVGEDQVEDSSPAQLEALVHEATTSLQIAGYACMADFHNSLGLELFEAEDPSQALEFFEAGCVLGNEKACFNAGICYEHGIGTQPDETKAMHYYQKAADKGHLNAIYNLGTFLYEGKAGSKDTAKAKTLFQTAAERGLIEAQRALGISHLDDENVSDAIPWLQAAAQQQDEEALYYLGLCHENGWGVEEDLATAACYYQQAADKKHPHATYNLAVLTEFGLGVPRHRKTARNLYQDAANAGSEEAQKRLVELTKANSQSSFSLSSVTEDSNWFYKSSPLSYSASFPNLNLTLPPTAYPSKSQSYALIHCQPCQSELVNHSHHQHVEQNIHILY